MKKTKALIFTMGTVLLLSLTGRSGNLQNVKTPPAGFYAYYTKVQHSATDYMGKYADIIVVLGEGKQLEFTRQTGYLPKWKTPENSYLIDDLYPDRDLDYSFLYNYVRLLENTPEKVVVQWHYFPYFKKLEAAKEDLNSLIIDGFTGVVLESFTIYPDGKVEREIKEARGTKYQDWINPAHSTKQTITLNDKGVIHSSVKWGKLGPFYPRKAVDGNPVKEVDGKKPVFYCSFNEGMEEHYDEIVDEISGEEARVPGLMTLFKKGVSGTALAFDGYYTGLRFPEDLLELDKTMSIEAWIALDAYPYNNAPIVHQSNNFGEKGFYFGVDPYGHLIFTLNGKTIKSEEKLPLWKWASVVATVGDREMSIYIDNEKVASNSYDGKINAPETDLIIGYNNEKERCTDAVRGPMQNLKYYFGIQGLLEEVKIYDTKLSQKELTKSYVTLEPKDRNSSLAKGVLPGHNGQSDKFGAFYKTTEFSEIWDRMFRLDDYADVIVKFDKNPGSVVYWHGTNYAANWVSDNNRWMSDQSSEIGTKHGCSEHMSDKQVRHCRVRIIENTPARVVVHWRYPCVDVAYFCDNKRLWTDEYHTIYPDGYGVRKVYWNGGEDGPGFEDVQFLTNPGETALDVVNINANMVANLKGDVEELVWKKPKWNPDITIEDASIRLMNSKSKYKSYVIYNGSEVTTWGRFENSKYTDDPFAGPWNHWPVNLVPSDGRFINAPDRVSHFALGASDEAYAYGSMVIYGLTDKSIKTLIPLAKSWRYAPEVQNTKGAKYLGYDQSQKAYIFRITGSNISFNVDGSEDSPVYNPCFVVKNWKSDVKAGLKIGGNEIQSGPNFRQGVIRDIDGSRTLIVWVEKQATSSVKFEVFLKVNSEP